jgi:hypothetical protein
VTITISAAYAAYYGTWQEDVAPWYLKATISANKLQLTEDDGDGYTIEGLTWEAYAEPDNNPTYPTGYKIKGELKFSSGYELPLADGSGYTDEPGAQVLDVWYISTDGKTLMWGDNGTTQFGATDMIFDKQ